MSDEFDFIAKHLRPLTHNTPGALGLGDDVALVPDGTGQLLVSADMLVEGTHFFPGTDACLLAQKALAVNVSDMIAKGAVAFGYVLSLALPSTFGSAERAAFAAGLAQGQRDFAIQLYGGDTTSTAGPLTINVTIMGRAGPAGPILRSGARVGDDVWVTGPIGQAWLGLQALLGEPVMDAWSQLDKASVIAAYERPCPPVWAREDVAMHASAAIDVSDGLLADLAHVARASGVGVELDVAGFPVGEAGRVWLAGQPDRRDGVLRLATGGDDYQIAFTAPVAARVALDAKTAAGASFSRIGTIVPAAHDGEHAIASLRLVDHGEEIDLPSRLGFTHF